MALSELIDTDEVLSVKTEIEEDENENVLLCSELKSEAKPLTSQLPDYMADQNAVLQDTIPWRHGHTPDYSAANNKFKKGVNFSTRNQP